MGNYNIKSTFVRKRNKNYNVIIEYYDEKGKLKQKSIGKYTNKKDADKHLIDLKSSINNNKFIISKDITVVDRCYRYIEDNKKDWSPYTAISRESYIKQNIEPFFKDTKLSHMTVYQIQKFVNYLYDNSTFESFKVKYSFFKAVIKEAYRMKEINENLCDFVKVPKKEGKVASDVYDKEEIIKLLQLIEGTIIELPILLIILLGLRKGEVYGLSWEDVDFENNCISINKISIYVNGKIIFKDPKTEDSKRTLSAPVVLMEKLKEEQIKQNKLKSKGLLDNEYNLVCLDRQLKPYVGDAINRYFRKFCKENNFRQIRIHDLRHTNATLLLLSGTDMKTISNRLGHSDIKITMNRYSHVLEEMDRKAADNLSKMLFK